MHYINIGLAPKYPSDCVSTFSTASGRYRLRSAGPAFHVLPRTSTGFGERGFFYSGPVAWNTLPSNFQDIIDTSTFRKRLKSVLFDRDQTDYCWCSWTCRIAAPYNSRVGWLIDCGLGYWADTTFHITYLLAFLLFGSMYPRVPNLINSQDGSQKLFVKPPTIAHNCVFAIIVTFTAGVILTVNDSLRVCSKTYLRVFRRHIVRTKSVSERWPMSRSRQQDHLRLSCWNCRRTM